MAEQVERDTDIIGWDYDPATGVQRARLRVQETALMPVRCRGCGNVHDAAKVPTEARYADCSMWRCPGCNRLLDDRPDMGGCDRLDRLP